MNYYVNSLGFESHFTWQDPPTYAVLKRDTIQLHLTAVAQAELVVRSSPLVYVYVDGIDALYQGFMQRGAVISNPIADRDYGMRDFDVRDPDGHILSFGCGIETN